MEKIPEIILVDKPKGITSFDVIRRLRKQYGIRKMGHAGTLDPLASGLLIIGVGEGTKKLSQFLQFSKVYEADVFLGKKTTTGDQEGDIIEQKGVGALDEKKVKSVLDSMVGKITLPVPLYSAVKVDGKRLYKIARKGKQTVTPPKKVMELKWVKLKDYFRVGDYYVLQIVLEVKSGTYIRSIAEEIGKRLGYPAVIKDLRRIKIGDYTIEDATTI